MYIEKSNEKESLAKIEETGKVANSYGVMQIPKLSYKGLVCNAWVQVLLVVVVCQWLCVRTKHRNFRYSLSYSNGPFSFHFRIHKIMECTGSKLLCSYRWSNRNHTTFIELLGVKWIAGFLTFISEIGPSVVVLLNLTHLEFAFFKLQI